MRNSDTQSILSTVDSVFSVSNSASSSPQSSKHTSFLLPSPTKPKESFIDKLSCRRNSYFGKATKQQDLSKRNSLYSEKASRGQHQSKRNSFLGGSFSGKPETPQCPVSDMNTNRISHTSDSSNSSSGSMSSFRTLKVRDTTAVKVKIDMGTDYTTLRLRKDKLVDLDDFINVVRLKVSASFSKIFIIFDNNKLNSLEINPFLQEIVFDYILAKEKVLVRVE